MNCGKKQYTKLFFKLLLLAVYFGFFTVQLFLRYTSSHSQQFLDLDNSYQKNLTEKSFTIKTVLSKDETHKCKSLSYLNKRFHPKHNVILPDVDLQIKNIYSIFSVNFYFINNGITELKVNKPSLRGPPAVC
ncbi:MAG TPA: hypothetical protein VK787_05535 [Puia sp.]|jgi:hypothetical protein|nr:hypothetical protein [Puia sp.]